MVYVRDYIWFDNRNEIMKIEGVNNVVCRSNGDLEIYMDNKNNRNEILKFLSMKSLLQCFVNIKFIEIPKDENKI